MEYDWYILFPSVHDGMRLERLLAERKIKYTITPTPRALSLSCGIAIRFDFDKEAEGLIKAVIEENNIKISGIYPLERKPGRKG